MKPIDDFAEALGWKVTRKQRTVPVAWQYRFFNTSGLPYGWWPWENCDEQKYEEIIQYIADGYRYEARALGVISSSCCTIPKEEDNCTTNPNYAIVDSVGVQRIIVPILEDNETIKR